MENGHKWSWKVLENHFQFSVHTLSVSFYCSHLFKKHRIHRDGFDSVAPSFPCRSCCVTV